MLVKCEECGRDVSDAASACPHCGHPTSHPAGETATVPSGAAPPAKQNTPIFLILAVVVLILSLWVPKLIIIVPVVACLVLAGISLFRKERFRGGSIVVIVLAIALMLVANSNMPGRPMSFDSTTNLSAAKITDWNWEADPTFGTKGTIKWKVLVQNTTDRPIASVKIDFSSFDAGGHLLASTFTYVEAIPPHGTKSDESFADYYGTEKTASAAVSEVRFSGD